MKRKSIILLLFALLGLGNMLSAQNVGITDKSGGITPASNLQVHKNATSGTIIQVTNSNTGETSSDGLHISSANSTFSLINKESDTINIGGTTNAGSHTSFEPDGTMWFKGQATVWDDITVPGLSTRSGVTAPTLGPITGVSTTIQILYFNASSTNEVNFNIQMPHTWVGTTSTMIYPHIHYLPNDNTSGVVRWGLEYSWVEYNPDGLQTFPASSTIYVDHTVAATSQNKHLIASFAGITPTANQDGISSVLLCRLFRDAGNGADTYAGTTGFVSFDIHYEKNTEGSRTEFVK